MSLFFCTLLPPPLCCTRQRIYRASLLEQRLVASKCHLREACSKILLSYKFEFGHKQRISISKVQNFKDKHGLTVIRFLRQTEQWPFNRMSLLYKSFIYLEKTFSPHLGKYSNLKKDMSGFALLLSVCVCVHASMLVLVWNCNWFKKIK